MSTSRMTLLKIAGIAGQQVMAKMVRWHAASRPKHGWGADSYPLRMRQQADKLAASLLACRVESPVIYRCDWIDAWSVGFPDGSALDHPQAQVIMGRDYLLWAWQFPDGGALERMAKAQLRRRRIAQESRWFYAHLMEAESSWRPIVEDACLLVIREAVSGSWTNEEVVAELGRGLRGVQAKAAFSGQRVHSRIVRI